MKKRMLALILILALSISLIPAVGALASTMYVYTSNGKSLNVRDYPSKDGKVISSIPYGTAVDVDNDFVGSSWVHVYLSGVDGYCMSRYLVTYKPGPKPQPTKTATPTQSSSLYVGFSPCYYTAYVRPSSPGGYVHLRWAPSKSQPVQRDYYNGAELVVISQNGTWCQIYDEVNEASGFMMASFLTTVN
ncbi:MAG: SH3 domain-containing protein [Clostridiales bacterium]|nr:SH3 domain-containing protein [Clostridiales bacterium]